MARRKDITGREFATTKLLLWKDKLPGSKRDRVAKKMKLSITTIARIDSVKSFEEYKQKRRIQVQKELKTVNVKRDFFQNWEDEMDKREQTQIKFGLLTAFSVLLLAILFFAFAMK